MTHTDLQRSILGYLLIKGFWAYQSANRGWYDPKRKVFIPSPVRGVPDITGATKAGRLFYVEVKAGGDTLKEDQINWFIACKKREIPCFCAYSLEEFVVWFKSEDLTIQAFNKKAVERL